MLEDPIFSKADSYVTLGLHRTSSMNEVKSAFKKLALRHHPDKPGGDPAQFIKIKEAYKTLLESTPDPQPKFSRSYSTPAHVFKVPSKNRLVPDFIVASFELTLEQLACGCAIQIDAFAPCEGGNPCPACAKTLSSRCATCDGKRGVIRVKQMISVPAGARDGVMMPVAPGCSVVIKQLKHSIFERDGDDLRSTIKISLEESLLGFDKCLSTPRGKTLHLKIKGLTAPGTIRKYAGHGMVESSVLSLKFEVVYPEFLPIDWFARMAEQNKNAVLD